MQLTEGKLAHLFADHGDHTTVAAIHLHRVRPFSAGVCEVIAAFPGMSRDAALDVVEKARIIRISQDGDLTGRPLTVGECDVEGGFPDTPTLSILLGGLCVCDDLHSPRVGGSYPQHPPDPDAMPEVQGVTRLSPNGRATSMKYPPQLWMEPDENGQYVTFAAFKALALMLRQARRSKEVG